MDLLITDCGWLLGPGVENYPAHHSWYYRRLETATGDPIALVWHYTATAPGTARVMAERRLSRRTVYDRAASWHVTIATDGTIWQMVPFTSGAWHCATGSIEGHRVNRSSVGIELEGHGKEFPEPQVAAATKLVRALVARYTIPRERCELNHSDFDPERRRDAGPVWNGQHLPGVLDAVFGPL